MDPDDTTTMEPGVAAVERMGSKSLLKQIQDRRDERVAYEVLTLDVPTWAGELRAKYQVVPRVELEKMIRKIQRNTGGEQVNQSDLDFLSRACVSVCAYDIAEDLETEITPGYTTELAELLGKVELDSARKLIGYLFKGNGIAVGAHAQKIARWMQDTSRPVSDEDPQ